MAATEAVAVIDAIIMIAIVTVTAIMTATGADGKPEKLSVKALGKVAEDVVGETMIMTNTMAW